VEDKMTTREEDLKSLLGVPIGTWLHGFIVIAFTFIAYYVSNQIAPVQSQVEDLRAWKIAIDQKAEKCATHIETANQKHKNLEDDVKDLEIKLRNLATREQESLEHGFINKRIDLLETLIQQKNGKVGP
jgi:hypothetical protein